MIPLLRSGQLQPKFRHIQYKQLIVEPSYVCDKPPFVYTCDAAGVKRVSRRNPRVKSCPSMAATGPCNFLQDKLPLKQIAEKITIKQKYARLMDSSDNDRVFKVVMARSNDRPGTIIKRYQRIDPSVTIVQLDENLFSMYGKGGGYELGNSLDELIPIMRNGELSHGWHEV